MQILAFSDALKQGEEGEKNVPRPVRIKCSGFVHYFVAFQWKMDCMKDDPNILQVGSVMGVEDKVEHPSEQSVVSVVSSKCEKLI